MSGGAGGREGIEQAGRLGGVALLRQEVLGAVGLFDTVGVPRSGRAWAGSSRARQSRSR